MQPPPILTVPPESSMPPPRFRASLPLSAPPSIVNEPLAKIDRAAINGSIVSQRALIDGRLATTLIDGAATFAGTVVFKTASPGHDQVAPVVHGPPGMPCRQRE